jgi:ribonuclease G
VAIEAERWLRDLAAERPEPDAFLVRVHPKVASLLVGDAVEPGPLGAIEAETGKHFHFEGSEALPVDHFDVSLEGSRSEVEERALPFREGEEVLVEIVEPHMYNDDDAVAKLDGYVISVTGASSLVGEKQLVRIDTVGRSAAQATLVNAPPKAEPSEDGDEPKPRRRGRRGGRRRRKAPESSAS